MKNKLLITALSLAFIPFQSHAVTDSEIDKIISQMEKTGKLDKAIDRAVERKIEKENALREKQAKDQQKNLQEKAKLARAFDANRDRVYGNEKAPVTLLFYTDLECPFCKKLGKLPFKIVDESKGKVNLAFRHFPLGFHNPVAAQEHIAAECVAQQAGNESFFKFIDQVTEKTKLNGQGVEGGVDGLADIASKLAVKDIALFKKCASTEGEQSNRVIEDLKDGAQNAGINGTPAIIVRNNKSGASIAIMGAAPLETYMKAIETVSK